MTIHEIIREARSNAGLTQHDLADAAAISIWTVRSLEQGRVSPSLSTLIAILAACGARMQIVVAGQPVTVTGEKK